MCVNSFGQIEESLQSVCVCVCVNSFGLFARWKIYKPLAKLATEAPSFINNRERKKSCEISILILI